MKFIEIALTPENSVPSYSLEAYTYFHGRLFALVDQALKNGVTTHMILGDFEWMKHIVLSAQETVFRDIRTQGDISIQ